jgi:hypothetical protein
MPAAFTIRAAKAMSRLSMAANSSRVLVMARHAGAFDLLLERGVLSERVGDGVVSFAECGGFYSRAAVARGCAICPDK